MTTSTRRAIATLATVAIALLSLSQPAGAAQPAPGAIADFEGTMVDLTEGWGGATACTTDGVSTRCFATESQMDQYLASSAPARLFSDCASSLRLYSNTSFGGSVLNLSARGFWLNLSSYGFDNVTSSYIVGACDSILASGSGGGGSWYPGATAAGASSSSMLAGWNDVISSAYIA